MTYVDTIVIGAGQAGLALSHHLTAAGHDHVVLERHEIGARWLRETWDSLRLLTPNWLNVLPGAGPTGADPDGFAAAAAFAGHLDRYADSFGTPVEAGVEVEIVRRAGDSFHIATSAGSWRCAAVVVATGWCDRPYVPTLATRLDVAQLTPDRYRRPELLAPGGVLVVGASATGTQLAAELRAAGRDVVLAVGRHSRLPAAYRGMDIYWWLQRLGALDRPIDTMADLDSARREPSLQLIGRPGPSTVDLPALQRAGVELVGRVVDADGSRVRFDTGLSSRIVDAERRLDRLLARIDAHIESAGLAREVLAPERRDRARGNGAAAQLDLRARGIQTVLWATGHRRQYPWLHLPVLDDAGEIRHHRGITDVPGAYALGQRFQYRRSSNFIGGVGADAADVAAHVVATHRGIAPPDPNPEFRHVCRP